MSDTSQSKDWEVKVKYGGVDDVLFIRASSRKSAEELAAESLKRRRRRPDTKVIGARERQKKP